MNILLLQIENTNPSLSLMLMHFYTSFNRLMPTFQLSFTTPYVHFSPSMCPLKHHLLSLIQIENLQLPLHGVEVSSELAVKLVASIRLDGVQVDPKSHLVQEVADGTSMPSSATELEPRKMPAERRQAEDCVGVLLDLLVRDGFLDGDLVMKVSFTLTHQRPITETMRDRGAYRIISGRESHEGNPDTQDGITGGSIAVVGVFSGVAPCYGLHFTIKFVQISDVLYPVVVKVGVLEHRLLVVCDELLHVGCK